MPEGVGYGSQDQFTSSGNYNSIGNHGYAYSGKVVVADGLVELLNFQTEKGYMVATVSFNYDTSLGGSNNYDFALSFNGIEIMKIEIDGPAQASQSPAIQMRKIIIPPYTNVVITAINLNSSTGHDCYALVTGKIH
jgi:hypothetical protein